MKLALLTLVFVVLLLVTMFKLQMLLSMEIEYFWRDSRNVWIDMKLFVVHNKHSNLT